MLTAAAASRAGCCPAAGAARRPARRPVAPLRAAENDGLSWLDQQRERRRHALLKPCLCAAPGFASTIGCSRLSSELLQRPTCGRTSWLRRRRRWRRQARAAAPWPASLPWPARTLCAQSSPLKPTLTLCSVHNARLHLTLAPASTHTPVPAPLQPTTRWLARLVCTSAAARLSGRTTPTRATPPATSTTWS